MSNEVWIIDCARTYRGIGKVGKGALSEIHPQRLLSTVLKALAARNEFTESDIDDVIAGCGGPLGKQGSCIARSAVLDAGWDNDVTGISVERFCGSGLSAVNLGAMGVMSGQQDLVIAGGIESMSYLSTQPVLEPFIDCGNVNLRKLHPQVHQGISADMIAALNNVTRQDADEYAVESQRRAALALEENRFDRSVVPVFHDDGSLALDREEYPRPGTTIEALSGLNPSFTAVIDVPLDDSGTTYRDLARSAFPELKFEHIHHAGNSSGVVDGAAAVLMASPEYAKKHGLKPRARVRQVANAGDVPELMLTAPGPAAERCMTRAGMTSGDIDLFEVNEAFAVVPIKFMRDLNIHHDKVNVNGGAIALGHPIGATGAMLVGTVLDELERRDLNTGLVTLCTGGGMAPATIIERV